MPKVYQAPLDASPYKEVNWSWPYTTHPNGVPFKMGLVSYVPNVKVFGTGAIGWEARKMMWWHMGAGQAKMGSITDGTSNTLFIVEKNMVTGDWQMHYQDWNVVNAWAGSQPNGINMWATTDTPETGMPFFGCICNDPSVT